MYEAFYGLKEKPFDLHPDPDYLFMSRGHENAYTHLEYAISENKGFVIVTGEIGSGKTTLINFLLTRVQQDMEVGIISNTALSPEQFILMLCNEFEVPLLASDTDKTRMIARFHEFLLEQFAAKKRVILIIDEAQNLTAEALEEIRMLSNLEAEKHHLIQTILVGQPELKYKLQAENLAQFAQRVTVHCHLEGLGRQEVEQYIHYRLKVAGAHENNIFSDDAVEAVFAHSRGIPRLINILCDTALVYGYADSVKYLDREVVEEVVKARKAGGLFIEDTPEQTHEKNKAGLKSDCYPSPGDGGSPLSALEKRVNMIEMVLMNLDKKLDLLHQKREKRDHLVVELFTLLQKNMESRMKMADVYLSLNKKFEALPSKTAPVEEAAISQVRSPASLKVILWLLLTITAVLVMVTLIDIPLITR